MGLVHLLGWASDRVTLRMLENSGPEELTEQLNDRLGFIRRAQLNAIIATSRPMMLANIINALALIVLEFHLDALRAASITWMLVVMVFAVNGLMNARRFRKFDDRETASVRAPGKIMLSSMILSVIWCYPAAAILPDGNPVEVAFISAVTAGMISGGAIALYPVPLASVFYTSILCVASFLALVIPGVLPPLPFGMVITAFAAVILHSARRHTGMFLSELVGKLEAERQRDIVNLLLDTYQDQEGQYLWRCDSTLNLKTKPGPLRKMLGLPTDDCAETNLIELIDHADATPTDDRSSCALSSLRSLRPESGSNFRVFFRTGHGVVLKLVGRAQADQNGLPLGYYGYIKDVTTEVQAREKVHMLATRDTMTGLLNYNEFCRQANEMLETSIRKPVKTLFLFVDADNLKTVNDNFGHAVGDLLIETMASRLEHQLPPNAVLARKGGDEFVALLHVDQQTRELDWADRLMDGLNYSFRCGDAEIPISCCIGISVADGRESGLRELELKADRALYLAKSHGKQKVRIYDETIGAEVRKGRVLANDIGTAIREGHLSVEFQPIVELDTRAIIGAEALVRWQHPLFKAISPEKIVEIAQAEGKGPALLKYVLGYAAEHAQRWPNSGFVSVNINSADLQRSNMADCVRKILDRAGLSANRLWLEVTDSEILRNSETVQANLTTLREAGVQIAIDDFGTGYSSLSHLGMYPSDIVKIDRALVGNCDTIDSNKIIINATRALASVNGFRVVAEGVETKEEISALQNANFEMAQGYAFHRPMSQRRILELLNKQVQETSNELPGGIEVA